MRLSAPATRRVAWFALGCHLLVAGGVPLPLAVPPDAGGGKAAASVAGKDRSRPFPCMDKPCGCATAEQCFASCCCHTPAQRLAWARDHAVDPEVVATLERRVAARDPEAPTERPAGGCCGTDEAEPACCAAAIPASGTLDGTEVCRGSRAPAGGPAAAEPTAGESPPPRVVILRDMLACGGVATAWLACGAFLPPPRVEAPAHDAAAGTIELGDDVAPSAPADLSAPPPRAC